MSFDWSDYLALARVLREDADPAESVASEEARLRSALSRAYYAAYGTAHHVAVTRDRYTHQRFDTAHQSLINHFKHSSDRKRKAIGANLERLLHDRVRADYHRTFKGKLDYQTNMMIQLAATVLHELETLS